MNNLVSAVAFFLMTGLYLFNAHKLDVAKQEIRSCKRSNVNYKELVAYQQMDTTNKKTIKLLYDINSDLHHKYDSLLTVKK